MNAPPRAPRTPRTVDRFLGEDRRLRVWPSKLSDRRLAMAWLAGHFEPARRYHEREVNELLRRLHAFEDWALLRRELYDHGYLDREGDGSAYWRRERAG